MQICITLMRAFDFLGKRLGLYGDYIFLAYTP